METENNLLKNDLGNGVANIADQNSFRPGTQVLTEYFQDIDLEKTDEEREMIELINQVEL